MWVGWVFSFARVSLRKLRTGVDGVGVAMAAANREKEAMKSLRLQRPGGVNSSSTTGGKSHGTTDDVIRRRRQRKVAAAIAPVYESHQSILLLTTLHT